MKKIKVLFLSIAFCMFFSANASAESVWEILSGDKLYLESYGVYRNGQESAKIRPSVANNNVGEYLLFDSSSNTLYWNNSADGDRVYRCSINDKTLTLYRILNGKVNYNNSMWIKVVKYDYLRDSKNKLYWEVYTIDSNNVYRYFHVRFK